MPKVDWDLELDQIKTEMAGLLEVHRQRSTAGNSAFVAQKMKIVEVQINLPKIIGRIRSFINRDFLLLPRERTMMHWGSIYLDSIEQLEVQRMKAGARKLWLQLIEAKLDGTPSVDGSSFDIDGLVELAVRQAKLNKAEKTLAENLIKLREERSYLYMRFHRLGVAASNKAAAGSFASRLGSSPKEALSSPEVKAFDAFATRLFTFTGAKKEKKQQKRLDATKKEYIDSAATLMAQCGDMIHLALQGDYENLGVFATLPQSHIQKNESRYRRLIKKLDAFEASIHPAKDISATNPGSYSTTEENC